MSPLPALQSASISLHEVMDVESSLPPLASITLKSAANVHVTFSSSASGSRLLNALAVAVQAWMASSPLVPRIYSGE